MNVWPLCCRQSSGCRSAHLRTAWGEQRRRMAVWTTDQKQMPSRQMCEGILRPISCASGGSRAGCICRDLLSVEYNSMPVVVVAELADFVPKISGFCAQIAD